MKKAGKVLTVMLLLTLLAGCNPAHAVEIDDGSGIRTENLPAKPWEQAWVMRDTQAGDREKPDGITMELYHAINSFRQENSVKALAWTDSFTECTIERVTELTHSFSHTRPNGDPFWTIEAYGDMPVLAEMFVRNADTAEDVMKAFTASELHRELMLNPDYEMVTIRADSDDRTIYVQQVDLNTAKKPPKCGVCEKEKNAMVVMYHGVFLTKG